jgi:hypothetical protein
MSTVEVYLRQLAIKPRCLIYHWYAVISLEDLVVDKHIRILVKRETNWWAFPGEKIVSSCSRAIKSSRETTVGILKSISNYQHLSIPFMWFYSALNFHWEPRLIYFSLPKCLSKQFSKKRKLCFFSRPQVVLWFCFLLAESPTLIAPNKNVRNGYIWFYISLFLPLLSIAVFK